MRRRKLRHPRQQLIRIGRAAGGAGGSRGLNHPLHGGIVRPGGSGIDVTQHLPLWFLESGLDSSAAHTV
jgi:hypothetical protein